MFYYAINIESGYPMKQFFKKVWRRVKQPLKIAGLLFLLLLSATMPQLVATSYEYSCYARSVGSSKILMAHYSNMITFAYNLAALATVLLVYICVRAILGEIKKGFLSKHAKK